MSADGTIGSAVGIVALVVILLWAAVPAFGTLLLIHFDNSLLLAQVVMAVGLIVFVAAAAALARVPYRSVPVHAAALFAASVLLLEFVAWPSPQQWAVVNVLRPFVVSIAAAPLMGYVILALQARWGHRPSTNT